MSTTGIVQSNFQYFDHKIDINGTKYSLIHLNNEILNNFFIDFLTATQKHEHFNFIVSLMELDKCTTRLDQINEIIKIYNVFIEPSILNIDSLEAQFIVLYTGKILPNSQPNKIAKIEDSTFIDLFKLLQEILNVVTEHYGLDLIPEFKRSEYYKLATKALIQPFEEQAPQESIQRNSMTRGPLRKVSSWAPDSKSLSTTIASRNDLTGNMSTYTRPPLPKLFAQRGYSEKTSSQHPESKNQPQKGIGWLRKTVSAGDLSKQTGEKFLFPKFKK